VDNYKQSPLRKQIQDFKRSFLQITGLQLWSALSKEWLTSFAESMPVRRDTIYTPLVTLRLFMQQVLSDDASCNAVVARFILERVDQGYEQVSSNSGPYCGARNRLPLELLVEGVKETGVKVARAAKAWTWRGFNVILADGTTSLMPDTEENQQRYPQEPTQKEGLGFPIVRIGALISLATGAVLDYALAPYEGKGTGETSLLSRMWSTLKPRDLLLADRYYATYAILALALQGGVEILMQSHAKRKLDYRKGCKLGKYDHLIEWLKPKHKPIWMSEEAYSALPDKITVREFRVNGIDFVTTLVDAKRHPKKELAKLYRERWKVEVDIRSIKTHMGMEMLRCKTPDMVEKEIAVNLLAYNLIRDTITQAALEHDKAPRDISFRGAVQLILAHAASVIGVANQFLKRRVDAIMYAIASNVIGNREQSPQPRAIKRRPKNYSFLNEPREEACAKL
jgi:hypothetical protein